LIRVMTSGMQLWFWIADMTYKEPKASSLNATHHAHDVQSCIPCALTALTVTVTALTVTVTRGLPDGPSDGD
jgi:hypothetical protein